MTTESLHAVDYLGKGRSCKTVVWLGYVLTAPERIFAKKDDILKGRRHDAERRGRERPHSVAK